MGKMRTCFLLAAVLVSIAVSVNAVSFTFYSDLTIQTNRTYLANCTSWPWNNTLGGCNPASPAAGLVNCSIYAANTTFGVNRTADANNHCALPASVILQTPLLKPNGLNRTGTLNGNTNFYAISIYYYGRPDIPSFEDFPFFWYDSTVNGCPRESDATPGMFYDPVAGKGKVLIGIFTPGKCNLEYLVPYVRAGGGAGIVMCDPTHNAESCGFTYYSLGQYGDKSNYRWGVFVLNMCDAVGVCAQAKSQYLNYNASGALTPRPARIRIWADVNNFLVPTNFWLEGPFYAFVRICLPIYGFFLTIWAAQRLFMFIRQQGGIKPNSLAQWSMLFEMIANACRAAKFATFNVYLTDSSNYGLLASSESLVMCNMILAAVFWGTLDVNSSPLYKYRYLCGFLCVTFTSVTIAIAAEAAADPATYAPIFTHWTFYNECAIGCAVFLFVPRRLYQLSKYQLMQQEMETKPAEAGEDAVKAAEEQADDEADEELAVQQQSAEANAVGVAGSTSPTSPAPATGAKPLGHRRRPPIVMKMLYWSCLISAYCIISIAQLICVTVYDDIPQNQRFTRENWFFYTRSTGICGMLMSTTQMLMYTPKKVRRPGQGSTAGSMSAPKTNASTA